MTLRQGLRLREWRLPRIRWRSIAVFLAVLGPGIITANVDNDAGGITTYSLAGAQYGYRMLWVVILITLSLMVVQEMGARMGAVTQKGLADLIREEFGVRATFGILLGLLLANIGNTMAEFAGVAWACELLGISKYVSVPLAAVLVWWLVLRGNYKQVERVFLVACSLYLTYVVSGILAHPDWKEVFRATVIPSFSLERDYLVMLIAVVGTTITPWMQFYLQSAIVEKGVDAKDYRYSRLDVVFGCVMTNVVAWFIVVSCGATLFQHHVSIQSAKDAALALAPLAGIYAAKLFALGLLNASIFAACILPLSTSYYVCEAFGFEAGINHDFKEAPVFYWLYSLMILLGAGFILIPGIRLVKILFFSQVANGILLPFVLLYMLKLVNNRRLMGRHVNSPVFNLVAWITTLGMIGLTVALLVTSVAGARDFTSRAAWPI